LKQETATLEMWNKSCSNHIFKLRDYRPEAEEANQTP
jgi:hypothetical protein